MNNVIIRSKRKNARPVPEGYATVVIDRSNPFLGNPFVLINAGDNAERARVISDYEKWMTARLSTAVVTNAIDQIAQRVVAGEKIALMCWCDPKPCHGEVLKRLVEERVQTLTPGTDDFSGPGM